MTDSSTAALSGFMETHARELAWIVHDTQGLWEHEDLAGEILLLLQNVDHVEGRSLDLALEQDALQILRALRRIARNAGRITRRSTRPDQAGSGDDWRPGTLRWEQLADDAGAHPQSLLEAAQSPEPEQRPLDPYHSELAAWQWLLQHIGRRTSDLATFLLISPSWCRQCRRRARQRAEAQRPLPPPAVEFGEDSHAVQPWRRFKLPSRASTPMLQQPLDFWAQPAQPGHGQLWLL